MKKILAILFLLLFLIAGCSGKYDNLAKCLTSKGVKFYGAFWCPHCANQKDMFGPSMQYINYVECSNQDHSQKEVCDSENITGYPTWVLPDGRRLSGEQTADMLSQASGCPI